MSHPTFRVAVLRSNPIAPDPRVEKILAALNNAGYQTTAVSWDRSGSLPAVGEVRGAQINRLAIRAKYGSGMQNFPSLIHWQFGLTRWLVRHHNKFDLIHACDFDTILPALYCKLRWKVKVIYDIFDFYADHLRRTPGWIKKIIRAADFLAIRQADAVILADDSRREQIRGSRPRRLEIIYNSPMDDDRHPEPPQGSPAGSLRLAYVGLLQKERGLLEILDVLAVHPSWHLDLAGFGGDEEEIIERARIMANVRWHGRIDYVKTLALSRQADTLFATYDPAIPNHRYSSPNKVFEAMLLAKPVIVARGTNMDRIIASADCGIVVTYGDKEDLGRALEKLSRDPVERERLGRNARRAYDEIYGWEKMEKRLRDLYRDVLGTDISQDRVNLPTGEGGHA